MTSKSNAKQLSCITAQQANRLCDHWPPPQLRPVLSTTKEHVLQRSITCGFTCCCCALLERFRPISRHLLSGYELIKEEIRTNILLSSLLQRTSRDAALHLGRIFLQALRSVMPTRRILLYNGRQTMSSLETLACDQIRIRQVTRIDKPFT